MSTPEETEETEDKPGEGEEYESITAEVDGGELTWHYKVKGAQMRGSQSYEEGVYDMTDEDIIELTMSELSVPEHQRSLINVEYV
jgi:hypothetical protein